MAKKKKTELTDINEIQKAIKIAQKEIEKVLDRLDITIPGRLSRVTITPEFNIMNGSAYTVQLEYSVTSDGLYNMKSLKLAPPLPPSEECGFIG